MLRSLSLCLLASSIAILPLKADDNDVTFHSDVSLVRVDAQVVDSGNRPIAHLHAGDFALRMNGRDVPIRNFASENMPLDVLFLLDVSASMRPHVQRIADASGQALTVLGKDDRMGIMVFDRYTRVRLAFNSNPQEVQRGFDRLLRDERFNGGTDITRAMLDAADYIRREGRRDARRAIVILTDDQTEFDRDDIGVGRALAHANAVMCALIAPDASQYRRRGPGGWGGGGPGLGGPLGGIIFGPRGGGNRYPGGGGGSRTGSAGTAEIARDSGGDSMSVNDASALQDTLERLRQRYTLYFNLPEGAQAGQDPIAVDLSQQARVRYPDAEVHYRRTSMSGSSTTDSGGSTSRGSQRDDDDDRPHLRRGRSDPGSASSAGSSSSNSGVNSVSDSDAATPPTPRRRVAVNEDGTVISGPSTDETVTAPPASNK
jgi:VWFA-related protein